MLIYSKVKKIKKLDIKKPANALHWRVFRKEKVDVA